MDGLPYFPAYPEFWLSDVVFQNMTSDQRGVYMTLVLRSWMESEPGTLPGDDEEVAMLANIRLEAWERYKPLMLRRFVPRLDGRLEHVELRRLATKAKDKADVRATAGRKGAEKRWNKDSVSINDAVCHILPMAKNSKVALAIPLALSSSESSSREVSEPPTVLAPGYAEAEAAWVAWSTADKGGCLSGETMAIARKLESLAKCGIDLRLVVKAITYLRARGKDYRNAAYASTVIQGVVDAREWEQTRNRTGGNVAPKAVNPKIRYGLDPS